MKKILFIISFFIVAVFVLSGCVVERNEEDGIKVAATIFPLVDIAQNIVGDKIEVVQILPSGASPHTFEITPEQVKKLQDVKVIFAIGHGLDDWVYDIKDAIGDIEIITVEKGIELKNISGEEEHEQIHEHEEHEHGDQDPHYWLSILNAKKIAENIKDELVKIDLENSEIYEENLQNYLVELGKLEEDVETKLVGVKTRDMVTFHNAWQYFVDEFDLDIVTTFEPFPGKEPTAKYLEELNKVVKEDNIKVIFSEPQMSNDVLKPFAKDLGLELFILDPLGGDEGRNSYIEMMEYNGDILFEALNK